jgi:hypothetical protein
MANEVAFQGRGQVQPQRPAGRLPALGGVMNNDLGKGGTSAPSRWALFNFVEEDPATGGAVVHPGPGGQLPARPDCLGEVLRPTGPSFGLQEIPIYREPVAFVAGLSQLLRQLLMYDMAHVLGLYGFSRSRSSRAPTS